MTRHIFASLCLDHQQAEPLYRQIYLRIKDAIVQGTLVANSRLPSVRGLASDLGVARATVENAYAALTAEGFLQSRGQAGTYVSAQLLKVPERCELSAIPILSTPVPSAFQSHPAGPTQPFQLGLPALDAFPRAVWQRIVARQLRSTTMSALAHPPPNGLLVLREAIVHYLHLSRGIVCRPEQVFICAGYQAVLELVINALLQPGEAVWLEDPGYPVTGPLFSAAGMQIVPVPVDEEGMNVNTGMIARPDARMAVLTPTHQSPLGVTLSLTRRMTLLDWASRQSAWIIEDDYDSECRYYGKPLPPLKSLDRQGRVLYAGTFSKTLFPALRMGYLVVPAEQVAAFERSSQLRGCGCPPLLQAGVADFINGGHFYRHLKRMRLLYRQRRAWLAQALTQRLADYLTMAPQAGGIQMLVHLTAGLNDSEVAKKAWQQGLSIQALSDWQMSASAENGLLLGFANFTSDNEAERAVARLAAIIER